MLKVCIWLINFYQQWLSFDTGLLRVLTPTGACRQQPRCSEYTKQMLIKHGIVKGVGLGFWRFIRCW